MATAQMSAVRLPMACRRLRNGRLMSFVSNCGRSIGRLLLPNGRVEKNSKEVVRDRGGIPLTSNSQSDPFLLPLRLFFGGRPLGNSGHQPVGAKQSSRCLQPKATWPWLRPAVKVSTCEAALFRQRAISGRSIESQQLGTKDVVDRWCDEGQSISHMCQPCGVGAC
jgi:hypothetical protein